MPIKTKVVEKKPPFPIYPINWGVSKYGVALFVNAGNTQFPDGVSVDVEDDEKGNFVGIGIYEPSTKACYYWSDWELAKQITLPPFIAHNGVSDINKLQKWGFKVDESFLLWDTMLTAHILDSSRKSYGLKALVKDDLGIEYPSYEDIVGKRTAKQKTPRITLDKQPLELVSEYNAMDCLSTYKLYEKQQKAEEESHHNHGDSQMYYHDTLERPVSFIFDKMSRRGVRLDLSYLKTLQTQLEEQKKPIAEAITNELGNINLNSPKQLLEALNAKQIQPSLKGKPSTDKRALELFKNNPIVSNLLRFSELDTLLSSFVAPYLERNEEVVHPQYRQTGTRTGRPSCSNPNLLQIPKRTDNGKLVRKMFIPRNGCLFGDCDFGQIEPRVLAHLSKDKTLCSMFNAGIDFHTFTADRLGIVRDRAKILNLSVGYRATHKSVSQQLKCSWDEAKAHIQQWWGAFPELYEWEQKLIYNSKKTGYCTTLLGRRIRVEELDSNNEWRREGAERQLINNITQGSAAEIMKAAMISVSRENIDILVQVYDELLFESPEECISAELEIVVEKMINTTKLDIPLTVDAAIGSNWAEVK